MRDAITAQRVKLLHPAIRDEVAALLEKAEVEFPHNMAIRVVQGLRTFDEQNELYAQGRTQPGPKVTNAKAGQSMHNYGLAIDFALLHDKDGNGTYEEISWDINIDFDEDKQKDWDEVVSIFKNAGYTWGGNWKTIVDNPHVEKTFGYNYKELVKLYTAGHFIPDTKYIKFW